MAIARLITVGGMFEIDKPAPAVSQEDPPTLVTRIEEVMRDDGIAYLIACIPEQGSELAQAKAAVLTEVPRRHVVRVDSVVAGEDLEQIFDQLLRDEDDDEDESQPDALEAPPAQTLSRQEPPSLFEVQSSPKQETEQSAQAEEASDGG